MSQNEPFRPNDKQVGGDHYKGIAVDVIRFCLIHNIEFSMGSAFKYIVRWRKKNGIEDLEKALHYLNCILFDRMERNPNGNNIDPVLDFEIEIIRSWLAQFKGLSPLEIMVIERVWEYKCSGEIQNLKSAIRLLGNVIQAIKEGKIS